MYHKAVLCLLLVAQAACLVSAQFFNPSETGKSVWRIGETQTIKFRTSIKNFNIALWQELGGKANLGPILYQTTIGTESEFAFIVNIDDLILSNSNKFFLWLKQGGIDQQGNISAPGMSSSYVIITDEPAPSSSSSIVSSTTISLATGSPTTLATVSSLTTTATGDPTPPAQTPGVTSSPSAPAQAQDGIVISTGAIAGIIAAAAVVVLAAVIGVGCYCFKRKWKRREKELQNQYQGQNNWRGTGGHMTSGVPPGSVTASFANSHHDPQYSGHYTQQDWKPSQPTEMWGDRSLAPAELSGGVINSSRRSLS